MPTFSTTSEKKLKTTHAVLQKLMNQVIKEIDITILCGQRTKAEQDAAFASGNSKLKWPMSKHNSNPSMAVDIAPWPIDWQNIDRFKKCAEIVKEVWDKLPDIDKDGYKLSWGGDWKSFRDYPHWEISK